MGDRCNLTISCRREDVAAFTEELGNPSQEDSEWTIIGEIVTMEFEEVNYGAASELETLTKAKLPFYGGHGSGSAYGPESFASFDGKYEEVLINEDGEMVAAVSEGLIVSKSDLANIKRYLAVRKKVKKLFGVK